MADDNGSTPAPEPETAADPVPASERLMGLFGLAVAIAIGMIALDLATGGAVARLAAGIFPSSSGASDDD